MQDRAFFVVVVLSGVVATSLFAQEAPLPSTDLMSQQATYLYRELNSMVKGEKPFDAAKADELVGNLISTARKIPATFAESLKGKSSPNARYSASPKVWESKPDFDAHATKLLHTLEENRSKMQTLDGLKAAYPSINSACNSCHETYRLRRS